MKWGFIHQKTVSPTVIILRDNAGVDWDDVSGQRRVVGRDKEMSLCEVTRLAASWNVLVLLQWIWNITSYYQVITVTTFQISTAVLKLELQLPYSNKKRSTLAIGRKQARGSDYILIQNFSLYALHLTVYTLHKYQIIITEGPDQSSVYFIEFLSSSPCRWTDTHIS